METPLYAENLDPFIPQSLFTEQRSDVRHFILELRIWGEQVKVLAFEELTFERVLRRIR